MEPGYRIVRTRGQTWPDNNCQLIVRLTSRFCNIHELALFMPCFLADADGLIRVISKED